MQCASVRLSRGNSDVVVSRCGDCGIDGDDSGDDGDELTLYNVM